MILLHVTCVMIIYLVKIDKSYIDHSRFITPILRIWAWNPGAYEKISTREDATCAISLPQNQLGGWDLGVVLHGFW